MSKKKGKGSFIGRFLTIFLILSFLTIAGLAGLAWWLLSRGIEAAPLPPPVMAFTSVDAGKAFNKLQPLGYKVMHSHPGQTEELVMTPGELNAVFSLASQASTLAVLLNLGRCDWPQGLAIKMEDRNIVCQYSRMIKFDNPFGKYFNVQVAFEPQVQDGKIAYRLEQVQIGSLQLPPVLLRKYLAWEFAENADAVEMFKKTVISMYIDDSNNFHLKFYPFQFRQIIANETRKKIPSSNP